MLGAKIPILINVYNQLLRYGGNISKVLVPLQRCRSYLCMLRQCTDLCLFDNAAVSRITSEKGNKVSHITVCSSCVLDINLKPSKSLHSRKSFVLGELSFARMPSRQYCLKVNKVHSCNWRSELVNCGQWQPWGVVTQHGMTQILGHPKLLQKLNAPHICRN